MTSFTGRFETPHGRHSRIRDGRYSFYSLWLDAARRAEYLRFFSHNTRY
jgi:hypothetical protein